VFNEHTDQDGATVFEHACRFGFEGIVSKRLSASYRTGPSRNWIKVKNPNSPDLMVAYDVARANDHRALVCDADRRGSSFSQSTPYGRLRASFSISVTVTLYFAITSLTKAVTWATSGLSGISAFSMLIMPFSIAT
jgi:hypothetical protein